MGLIKAAVESVKGTLADQWKEGVYCPAMSNEVILRRGSRLNEGKGSNTKGNPDVITNGSVILVEENTCMLTIDSGRITNIVTEPGSYTFDNSSAPSIFAGQIADTLKEALTRLTFGGTAAVQQRVVYINLMPLPSIPFGTPTPVPYFDTAYNTTLDLRFFGTFEIQVPDAEAAVKFYNQVASKGQDSGDMFVKEIFKGEQYKTEFMMALKEALAKLSVKNVRYSQISAFLSDLTNDAKEATKNNWQPRGFLITNVAMGPATLSPESEKLLAGRRQADTMLGGDVQRAMMAGSVAKGIEAAAGNESGAMMGFMGLNMAQNMGGNVMGNFGQAPDTAQAQQMQQGAIPGMQQPMAAAASAAGGWKCACGADNTGKFCAEYGGQKPEPVAGWACACGATNAGKFCAECGSAKPEAAESSDWACECGATNSGKFCAECGKSK